MSLKRQGEEGPSLKWKFWLLLNYKMAEGSSTPVQNILDHANSEKENLELRELTARSLTTIVNDTWHKGKVVKIKKRSNSYRYPVFQNLSKKNDHSISSSAPTTLLEIKTALQVLPDRWQLLSEENQLSLIRTESELDGHRLTTEICIEAKGNNFDIHLKSFGRQYMHHFMTNIPILEKIYCLLTLIDRSRLCKGIVHNKQCTILAQPESDICTECSYINKLQSNEKRRKLSKGGNIPVHPFCNHRYMTRQELIKKIEQKNKIQENTARREKYWKAKFTEESLEFEEEDNLDLMSLFKRVEKQDVPENMVCLWEQQSKILKTASSKACRWHPKMIRLCIDLYCKNPHVLDRLRKFIYLPSNRTIRNYKNKVEQSPGWNRPVLSWCLQEAKARKLSESDYWGGFVLDEMKIQEDLELAHRNGKHRLVGFVELGPAHDYMTALSGKTEEPQLANQVLQFLFLSDGGFRFPVAQFPSRDCTPSDLYLLFWEGVMKMFDFGFIIYWTILDGAECNRQFVKMHFLGREPKDDKFISHNPSTGIPMIFMVDCKHNFKKIRNNLEKSRLSEKPRCLVINGKKTLWQHFVDAYNWDQENNSLVIHEKLTSAHFNLDPSSKMRNHLAEDVLDAKMLFLVQEYQNELSRNGSNDSILDGAITLLQQTSSLIELFTNKYTINNVRDSRLKRLSDFHSFIESWRDKVPDKNFISTKLHFDLQAMCLGFISMDQVKLQKFSNSVIKPAIVNQDCVENHFCQVRSNNGQNDNPTYLLQESAQNSIRFGQTTISRKSNAGLSTIKGNGCSVPVVSLKKSVSNIRL